MRALFWAITAAPSVPVTLMTSLFQLQYAPSARLLEAEIGVIEDATSSVLVHALLAVDGYNVSQTQVVFQLLPGKNDTLIFQVSTVSNIKTQQDWQAFVEATLLQKTGVILNTTTKYSELAFLTDFTIEPANTPNASTPSAAKRQKFSRLDYSMLVATIILLIIFFYLMFLNYRDWKLDRLPQNIDENKYTTNDELFEKSAIVHENANEQELNDIMEKITKTSDVNTSHTKSTKDTEVGHMKPYHWNDQDDNSLEVALAGLSDTVEDDVTVVVPEDRGNVSIDGTIPSDATSDVFDMVDDRPFAHDAPWMNQIRISVIESHIASDSFQNAMVTTASSVCTESGLESSEK